MTLSATVSNTALPEILPHHRNETCCGWSQTHPNTSLSSSLYYKYSLYYHFFCLNVLIYDISVAYKKYWPNLGKSVLNHA